jgi:hypothetical protein
MVACTPVSCHVFGSINCTARIFFAPLFYIRCITTWVPPAQLHRQDPGMNLLAKGVLATDTSINNWYQLVQHNAGGLLIYEVSHQPLAVNNICFVLSHYTRGNRYGVWGWGGGSATLFSDIGGVIGRVVQLALVTLSDCRGTISYYTTKLSTFLDFLFCFSRFIRHHFIPAWCSILCRFREMLKFFNYYVAYIICTHLIKSFLRL